jgi:hypothetical protein
MTIREIAGHQPDYFNINREERNHAAILFSALCRPENVRAFMRLIGVEAAIGPEFGIYFEYAYLRDLWHTIADDATRREIIRQKPDPRHRRDHARATGLACAGQNHLG